MFQGAELSDARLCLRQPPGTEAELTTGGEGDSPRAKKEKESKFPSAAVTGRRGREAGASRGGGSE